MVTKKAKKTATRTAIIPADKATMVVSLYDGTHARLRRLLEERLKGCFEQATFAISSDSYVAA